MQASSYRKPRKIELTDEQRAKTEARKARFRELVKHIASLDDSARVELASRMPVVSVEGRGLSVHNQCLIAMQYPSATVVGGFAQWLKHGRAVRKGQSGMMIWVPITRKANAEAAAALGVNPDKQPDDTRFIMGTVFDVSQTDVLEATAAPARCRPKRAPHLVPESLAA